MMKRFILSFVSWLFYCSAFSQPGHYFLSHYKPGNDNISYLSFDIQQDNNGILYFANRSGVLQFDGRTWAMVGIKGAVYSLSVTSGGQVYAAGTSGFGKIGLDALNQINYLSLSDSLPKAKNIFSSHAHDSSVYFLNNEGLYQLRERINKPSLVAASTVALGGFTGLYQIGPHLYLATANEGLKKIENGSLTPADPSLTNLQLVFSEPSPDKKTYFIATEDNRFFILKEGQALRECKPNDAAYLNTNVVANATWVTESLVAIGTLRGGVVFINIDNEETVEISNYYTGLPDNEVYALLTDRHQGVWVAHDYGFTRIAPFLPFRTFNHYPGLAGNLLCVQTFADQVYVGTTLGLFRLSREEIFENEAYSVTQQLIVPEETPAEVEVAQKKSRRKLFSLKKKKEEPPPAPVEVKQPAKTKTVTKRIQKTRQVLRGIDYAFKRVEGISGKVDQLTVVNNKLLCGGVGGVFEVNGLASTSISREPVRTFFYSKNLQQLLLSTYNDEIKAFASANKGWKQSSFPDSLSIYADYMFEDNVQDLWICGRDRALKVGIEEGEILDAESIPLPYTSVDRTVGLAFGQEVYLTQNGEFFHYASFKNAFIKYDSLPGPKKYFASAGYFWFYDGHRWRTVDRRLQGAIKTEWLGLFPDIRFLAPTDQNKSLWVITASNELYKFSSEQSQLVNEGNPLFLKEVRNQQLKLSPRKTLSIEEDESALTFEFIQPEYVSLLAVEYRYWVKGLQSGWSEWSTLNNIINFPFLPPGKYNVLVQSKDLFGKITEVDSIDFNVVPPYWKRPWFYALEFLFFGTLVVLSLRLNVANTRYRYLNRFLSTLTIIMLIQLVQTIAASNISLVPLKSTPVADFFVQVFMALLVLPVESFLRNRMVKASEKRAA